MTCQEIIGDNLQTHTPGEPGDAARGAQLPPARLVAGRRSGRPEDAAATEVHEGRTFYFCSKACHDTFVNDPHRYGHPKDDNPGQAGHGHH